ncbi:MAG: ribonuclease III [Candidatus Parcubacteria bacterium]|nr:ribonuclease III [Candidatus Parcubacteria bacterium]
MTVDFSQLEKKLDIVFSNINLLKQALTHRSYLNENKSWPLGHNERLEFLGDAVLELSISNQLYKKYPQLPEGLLTSLRASLVNSNNLVKVAESLKLENFLLLSKGGKKDSDRSRTSFLANATEAVIGAIYLDQGFEGADKFINRIVMPDADDILNNKLFKDAKSLFQEISQERLGVTPIYQTLKAWGPDHDKHFVVGVFLAEEQIAEGEGISKHEAEQNAASQALKNKEWS